MLTSPRMLLLLLGVASLPLSASWRPSRALLPCAPTWTRCALHTLACVARDEDNDIDDDDEDIDLLCRLPRVTIEYCSRCNWMLRRAHPQPRPPAMKAHN